MIAVVLFSYEAGCDSVFLLVFSFLAELQCIPLSLLTLMRCRRELVLLLTATWSTSEKIKPWR